MDEERPLFSRVPDGFFARVVDRFYDGVEADPVLLPLYPEGSDTVGARRRLAMFLEQYFGGSTAYSDERGHPRLRMRHVPYLIGELERDRWLVHMVAAIEAECGADADAIGSGVDEVREEFVGYVTMAAEHLRDA
jgi:hemoglobin